MWVLWKMRKLVLTGWLSGLDQCSYPMRMPDLVSVWMSDRFWISIPCT